MQIQQIVCENYFTFATYNKKTFLDKTASNYEKMDAIFFVFLDVRHSKKENSYNRQQSTASFIWWDAYFDFVAYLVN